MRDYTLFSKRFDLRPSPAEITVRDDAPEQLRYAILAIATTELSLAPSAIRDIICPVLLTPPDQNNWSEYPNIWSEVQDLMYSCEWYRVYDICEAVYRYLSAGRDSRAHKFEESLNRYFIELGIGWQMIDGIIEARGDEAFELAMRPATETIVSSPLKVAGTEITEALQDLSRRPSPDLSGAVQHAVAALEATARFEVNDTKNTLGDVVKKNPGLFPGPLSTVVEKLWGYSSEVARHGKEGRQLDREEVELMVGLSAVLASYLAKKME